MTAGEEDLRVLNDTFAKLTDDNTVAVLRLLNSLCLDGSHLRLGLSSACAVEESGLAGRTGRWWLNHLCETGHVRKLDTKVADVRAVVPAHWRITRTLCRQLTDVLDELPQAPRHLASEFRLNRSKFLDDIEPARVGVNGATDWDHDVTCQAIVAHLLRSDAVVADGVFAIEPKHTLDLEAGTSPQRFTTNGTRFVHYQPDAELRVRRDGRNTRCVVEYERYQSRRDAWSHLERFVGWLGTRALGQERAELLFVVDSPQRVRPYVELLEAFDDHLKANPRWRVTNSVTVAVGDKDRLTQADDPLDWQHWRRIELPTRDIDHPSADTGVGPVLHDTEDSPYQKYFARD